ncbi:MAG: YicC/YloC family endoribonuclease [Gemmatimonadota bacterium]|nr:YicC/YloC family endoribonuclease [Gemmatimonadota bacterium]
MIRSMTGFGRGETEVDGYLYRAEIKSVNHRYFNANVRLPREFAHLESRVSGILSERVERGHLNVALEVEPATEAGSNGPRLDREVLDGYLEIVESLEGLWNVRKGGVSVEALLSLPGVVAWEDEQIELPEEEFFAGAGAALEPALDQLIASRETEGRALEADLRQRIAAIEERREQIGALAPEREASERERLRAKIADLLGDLDEETEGRIDKEIVLLADRIDVAEELTRMRAHLDHFVAELDADGGAVGRKLTFILQELLREANTIGSKANDPDMQQAAIEIKSEIEKMREQAENVE